MSREFENAMCGYAARSILNADRPLQRHEIFPKEGVFAKQMSKTWQKTILGWLVKDGYVSERKKNGVMVYEARNKAELADIARACPPDDAGEEDEIEEVEPMRTGSGYNKKEWERYARVTVALRALKRLLASHQSGGDSSKVQPKTTLFIAKKGDKFQQRQVIDTSWQKVFLDKLVDDGVLHEVNEVGIPLYGVSNVARVTGLVEQNTQPCIYELLWPGEPCRVDHTKKAASEEEDEEDDESVEEPEEESDEDEGNDDSEQPVDEKVTESVAQPATPPAEVPAADHTSKEDEKGSMSEEALSTMLDLITKVTENQSVMARAQEAGQQLMKRMIGELEHLHSKLDKIHDENVHLRKEHESMEETLSDLADDVERIIKAVNPEESSMNAIRKRLGELEKLSKEHAEALHSSNQLMKGSLAEAAGAMVNAAAKAFIQTDHSAVLTKMETVESHLVEEQSRTQHVLNEVFEALEKVRAEYKNSTRIPAVLDRMAVIGEELKKLQGLLPELPAMVSAPAPDLSGV